MPVEAFEVSAVDYLLKPFDQERFPQNLAARAAAPCKIRGG
jgi:DNA-binding LytR/AlgR family response regulator